MISFMLCVCLLFSLTACGTQTETPEQRIERVLARIFTCPDEGTRAYGTVLKENLEHLDSDAVTEAEDTLRAYLHEAYSPDDFSEKLYESLFDLLYVSLAFPTQCALEDYEIFPETVYVEADGDSGLYRYAAKLQIKRDSQTVTVTQTGRVQVDTENRISSVDLKDSALYDALF